MLPYRNMPRTMPVLSLNIHGRQLKIQPVDQTTSRIDFANGTSLVLTIENTGIDNQNEDWMYKGRYFDAHGRKMPGGHTFGTTEQMTRALTMILNNNKQAQLA